MDEQTLAKRVHLANIKFCLSFVNVWSKITHGFFDEEAGYYKGEHRDIYIGVGPLLKF